MFIVSLRHYVNSDWFDLAVPNLKQRTLDFVVCFFQLDSISMRHYKHLTNLIFLVCAVSNGTLFFHLNSWPSCFGLGPMN